MSKMNLEQLKKLESKKYQVKIVEIEVEGQKFKVKMDRTLKQSKIKEMLMNSMEKIEMAETAGITPDELIFSNISFLETFTDLDFPEDLAQCVQMFEIMVDLGVFEKIMGEFKEEELNKIQEAVEELVNNIPQALEIAKKNQSIEETIEKLTANFEKGDGKIGESGDSSKKNTSTS